MDKYQNQKIFSKITLEKYVNIMKKKMNFIFLKYLKINTRKRNFIGGDTQQIAAH